MQRIRLAAIAAATTSAAVLAAAPAAPAAYRLTTGIYDCYAYNSSTGFSNYMGSVRFLGGGRYEHTFGRDKQRFEDKTTGRYRIRGRRIVFKGGAMAKTPGRIHDTEPGRAPSFEVWVDGEPSGVTCTYVEKP
ncbi:MAG TPA: hypothetical protein VFR97_11490 [Capillimicrobium sp.]|nr:hypothetical protein [Capillimicrobium sp.]